jgi:uncharacterized protein YdiU (UPF0061 family)
MLSVNPFLNLAYQSVLEKLGNDYYDVVPAAEFPKYILRWRHDQLLPLLGLTQEVVTDQDFIEAFGKLEGVRPFLALRYHGYQFGQYNPNLGDGRGFLYGQIRGTDGKLYDLGTKGSGKTPYSRSADGRLTLKGGVREVLAGEALHALGVNTSRCLSLVETGESLWRGDEPSPTRSSVMIRLSKSHIRFGTFERLHYIKRSDLIKRLLDHVLEHYYSGVTDYGQFYAQLVERVAKLAAQWMAAGFCHGVLNTDNMSITGESFDYGPYAFIETYNPHFTAAYFDYSGLYSYGNQPYICRLNLERLQVPLSLVIPIAELEAGLAPFEDHYHQAYHQLMIQKLGFDELPVQDAQTLLKTTIILLRETQIGYHDFFYELAAGLNPGWRQDAEMVLENAPFAAKVSQDWRNLYHQLLQQQSPGAVEQMQAKALQRNPRTALLRPSIEEVWQPIVEDDDWQPFYELVQRLQNRG